MSEPIRSAGLWRRFAVSMYTSSVKLRFGAQGAGTFGHCVSQNR
jgi:hypothetical protein